MSRICFVFLVKYGLDTLLMCFGEIHPLCFIKCECWCFGSFLWWCVFMPLKNIKAVACCFHKHVNILNRVRSCLYFSVRLISVVCWGPMFIKVSASSTVLLEARKQSWWSGQCLHPSFYSSNHEGLSLVLLQQKKIHRNATACSLLNSVTRGWTEWCVSWFCNLALVWSKSSISVWSFLFVFLCQSWDVCL